MKIKYIKDNIFKIENHNKIIDYIKTTGINYSNNSNGIFINLNKLKVDQIDKIYYIIKYEMDYKNNFYKNIYDEDIKDEKIKIKKEIKDIYLNEFKPIEQEIIISSKKI